MTGPSQALLAYGDSQDDQESPSSHNTLLVVAVMQGDSTASFTSTMA